MTIHQQSLGEAVLQVSENREAVVRFVREHYGVELSDSKYRRVWEKIRSNVQERGDKDVAEYLSAISRNQNLLEASGLSDAVTTNVTSFFRENHHFELFETDVVPGLRKKSEAGEPIRIWSAGCSKGPEPYSIGMTLMHAWPDAAKADVKILATDIDSSALHTAKEGRYPKEEKQSIPQKYASFYDVGPQVFEISDVIKRMIVFRPLNLVLDLPFSGMFDVIFCRNVAIYFSDELQAGVWRKIVSVLKKDGTIFIGHSERIENASQLGLAGFGRTGYRKSSGLEVEYGR